VYFTKTPNIIRPLAKDLLWSVPTKEKHVYLTFDDGPHPEITLEVMELLSPYNAKATFFCVGENVRCFPEVVRALLDAGHALGNHTEQHVNGWKTSTFDYARNYLKCAEVINSRLFRPPYGRITKAQTDCLKSRCEIVMWDVLSADFDAKVNEEQCYQNVVRNVVEGSIVVFHDSEKAAPRMLKALPRVLEDLSHQGYEFHALKAFE